MPLDGQTQGEATEVAISVFRVKATLSVEDSLILEWPGQAGNSYQVESRLRSGSTNEAPEIATSITPDEDKTLAALIPPEGLSDRAFLVRCISEAGELTSEVTIGGSP
jgi:hypothetical protein